MSNIAIITARGGSKRIQKKNIKNFLGKPIISYSIETALKCGLFDKVIVSTDDKEISELSIKLGASVPFHRGKNTSGDYATTSEVLIEVLEKLKEKGEEFTNACCIYPTAPFITCQLLDLAYNIFKEEKYDTVFPVCAFGNSIARAFRREFNGKTMMIWPANVEKRSQDIELAYHDAGQFYWFNIKTFLEKQKLFTDNTGSIIIDELHVQDIDTETDWKIAELKYEINAQRENEKR